MNWRWIAGIAVLVVIAGGAWYALSNKGAEPNKTYKIGILVRGSGYDPGVAGFKKRMEELGYHEGKNVTYDMQLVSDQNKLAGVVDQFLSEGVDLIHTYSTPATEAAIKETNKPSARMVPIVFGSVGDPLLLPDVKSIDHPGGNATGVASLSIELTTKRLQLLKEFDPSITRVAMPRTDAANNDPSVEKSVSIAQSTAKDLGMQLTLFPVKTKDDNTVAAAKITRKDFDGMIVGGDSLVWGSLPVYAEQAIKEKIPFSVFSRSQVEQGALFGLGPDFSVSGKQSADIANKILRGGNPAEIAVQIPQKLILVVNQDTAHKMGITFSDAFLKKADVVIGGQ